MAAIRGALEYLERSRTTLPPQFIRNIYSMLRKKGMIAAAAIAALGTGGMGITSAYAAENTNPRMARMENLMQALADEFNVTVEEVQAVFEAQRAEMEASREEREAERLAQAVTDGIITQEQADAISAHRDDMEALMESLEDATPEERKEALDAQREANKAWAEENNIPAEFLRHEGPQQGNNRPHHGPRPE